MRTWTNSLAALVALVAVGLAAGQPSGGEPKPKPAAAPAKPAPNSLEAVVAAALKHNPDILHAEAKVNEASAGLNKARLHVMQTVVTAHGALEAAKATLQITEVIMERTKTLGRTAVISQEEVQKAEYDVQRAKAEVATLDAQLALLLGKAPGQGALTRVTLLGEFNRVHGREVLALAPDGTHLYTQNADNTVRLWGSRLIANADTIKPAAGSMDEKIRAALNKTIKIETWKEPLPVGDVIEYLRKKTGTEVPFRILSENPQARGGPRTVDLMTGELPLSAWLAVIEDSVPGLVFVVREYGVLVTYRDRMPDTGLRVREFLQRTEPKKDEAKKP